VTGGPTASSRLPISKQNPGRAGLRPPPQFKGRKANGVPHGPSVRQRKGNKLTPPGSQRSCASTSPQGSQRSCASTSPQGSPTLLCINVPPRFINVPPRFKVLRGGGPARGGPARDHPHASQPHLVRTNGRTWDPRLTGERGTEKGTTGNCPQSNVPNPISRERRTHLRVRCRRRLATTRPRRR
jgi:hypothetical protein